jgi:asparagine synthase (glutamine-hydrolysing)
MCGICGIFHFDRDTPVERDVLEVMNRSIVHRGPDEDGFYVSGNVGLAMRRLSIIDLRTGQQPVTNEDGDLFLIYNGEIYNHEELRAELQTRGHHFRSRSDTETIVHLYEEYGHDCVRRLRGMFAFSLWDARTRKLFIARDRLGIKPLYYRYAPEMFLWGSEIKAILAHPSVRAELNPVALPEYLAFGYLSGSETLYRGIEKLMPGQWLEVGESGQLRIESYWDVPQATTENRPERWYVDQYRGLLEQAVESHLMSDVPLGVFLSGGLDSSAVAALMTKIRRAPVETFSVGYDEQQYSELPYAETVAKHLGSIHHEVRVSRQEFFDALPKLIWHEDEPVVWPSSVALYFVAQLARERVTVVLTGEGSDETLAGYTRYPWTVWNARFDRVYRTVAPQALRRYMRHILASSDALRAGVRRKLEHTFLGRDGSSFVSFYFDNFYAAFSETDQTDLLAPDYRGSAGEAYRNVLAYWEQSSGDLLGRLLYTDLKTYLVELCMKQDQMSMAASIESRVPFLDHLLVEFATTIPARVKTSGLNGKQILKAAVTDLLPDSIVYRKKMGFPTPIAGWLLGPQMETIEDLLLEPRSLERGLFKQEAVRRIFAEHRTRRRDHTDRIWRLLNLELWHRVCVEKELGQELSQASHSGRNR